MAYLDLQTLKASHPFKGLMELMLFWTRQFISTTFLLTLFLDMNHVPVAFGVWTKIDAGPFALLVLWFEKLKQCIYDTKNRRIDWAHKWTYLNSLNFIDVVRLQVKNFYLQVGFITFFLKVFLVKLLTSRMYPYKRKLFWSKKLFRY